MRITQALVFRVFPVIGFLLAVSVAPATADPVAKTLYAFCHKGYPDCPDGAKPEASLVRDAAGNIFGTTMEGGKGSGTGTVFELAPNGKRKTLHEFCDSPCADGMSPYNPLIMDVSGNLYGMVTQGGTTSWGVVFKLTPKQKKYAFSVLYTFCEKDNCPDGQYPIGGLTYQGAQSGALYDGVSPLYGATAGDGSLTFGSVFQLTPKKKNKAQLKTLAVFCDDGTECPEGYNPGAGVVLDASGNIYGTTANGGAHGQGGGVFELTRQARSYGIVTLHAFCALSNCADGARPIAPMVIDGSGNLIGTTLWGGANTNNGTVFSVTPNGTNSQETVLHAFCSTDCHDGGGPHGGMALGTDGTLYGTAAGGGANGGGTVFAIKGSTFTVLVNFHSGTTDPADSQAGLILDAAGNLYGTSVSGGNGAGTVFEVTP